MTGVADGLGAPGDRPEDHHGDRLPGLVGRPATPSAAGGAHDGPRHEGWTAGDPERLAHAAELVDAELDLSVDARVLGDALVLLRRCSADLPIDVADLHDDLLSNVERSLELAAWVMAVSRVLRHGADLGDGVRVLPDRAIVELVGHPVVGRTRPPGEPATR
ncbi:MAG: hypothetical protein S0880_23870 [Actinomycetota bacterium]|nr:hypothetical protein [Actinomycetota bacterium]